MESARLVERTPTADRPILGTAVVQGLEGTGDCPVDLTPWFAQATEAQLADVVRHDWAGEEAIFQEIVAFCLPGVDRAQVRFCEVPEHEALAWLQRHHPELAERVEIGEFSNLTEEFVTTLEGAAPDLSRYSHLFDRQLAELSARPQPSSPMARVEHQQMLYQMRQEQLQQYAQRQPQPAAPQPVLSRPATMTLQVPDSDGTGPVLELQLRPTESGGAVLEIVEARTGRPITALALDYFDRVLRLRTFAGQDDEPHDRRVLIRDVLDIKEGVSTHAVRPHR